MYSFPLLEAMQDLDMILARRNSFESSVRLHESLLSKRHPVARGRFIILVERKSNRRPANKNLKILVSNRICYLFGSCFFATSVMYLPRINGILRGVNHNQ